MKDMKKWGTDRTFQMLDTTEKNQEEGEDFIKVYLMREGNPINDVQGNNNGQRSQGDYRLYRWII